MAVSGMNHFTLLTGDLPATLAFYERHLGLRPGPRPDFGGIPGAWLYAEGSASPILHIIAGRDTTGMANGLLDHMAFTGQGLNATIAKLKADGLRYRLIPTPAPWLTWQLFFRDPNGASVEIDFDGEQPDADALPPRRAAE